MARPNRLLARARGLVGPQVQLPRLQGSDLAVRAVKHDAVGEAPIQPLNSASSSIPVKPASPLAVQMHNLAPRSSDGKQAWVILSRDRRRRTRGSRR